MGPIDTTTRILSIIHLAVLLYPSKMFYPVILPLVSMFDAFYKDAAVQRKLKLFWIAFIWFKLVTTTNLNLNVITTSVNLLVPVGSSILVTSIFFWEILPEWMFPLLTGFSIVFCFANPRSADFTRIFGGSGGNEGLGFLFICLEQWNILHLKLTA